MVASAQLKFASEATLSSGFSFGKTEPTCIQLSGHFLDVEGRVLVYRRNINSRMKFASEARLRFYLWQYRADLFLCQYLGTLWALGVGS